MDGNSVPLHAQALTRFIVNASHNATSITPESSSTLEERKPLTENEWRACPRLPTARKLHGVCSKNSKIYVFGGTTAGSFKPLTSAEVYDEKNQKWQKYTGSSKTCSMLCDNCVQRSVCYLMG